MTTRKSMTRALRQRMVKFGILSKEPDVQWGDLKLLEEVDLSILTRASLKRHLEARKEEITGNKAQLINRLISSLKVEKEKIRAKEEQLETKHREIANLEENGAVYVIGSNHKGQLGLGDLNHTHVFTAIPYTRGLCITQVEARNDLNFAISSEHNIYTWGGSGMGPMGLHETSKARLKFETPQMINAFEGEEIVQIAAGANHVCALSDGGDIFVMGDGKCGCLGLGDFSDHPKPVLLRGFEREVQFEMVKAGEVHTCALTRDGELYTWGHFSDGRLGLGKRKREGVPDEQMELFNFPSRVLLKEKVKKVACGSEHSIALTSSGIYSWGVGDGGRLGHGDFEDRWEPNEIKALQGCNISDISCGVWHSSCIVIIPPMKHAGLLYTWGSGYHGQLGQGKIKMSPYPSIVTAFMNTHLYVKSIFCGSHHNAAIVDDGELYTWGSNQNGCLGHSIDNKAETFTSVPGHVGGFGAIVGRIGRGMPRSVACGKGYTIVATYKYDGPSEEDAKLMIKEYEIEKQRRRKVKFEETQRNRQVDQETKERERRRELIMFLTQKRLCTLDPNCTGFQVHATKPSICRECGHSSVYHTIIIDDDEVQN